MERLVSTQKLALYATFVYQSPLKTHEMKMLLKTTKSITRPTCFRVSDPNTFETMYENRLDLVIFDRLETYGKAIQGQAKLMMRNMRSVEQVTSLGIEM